MSDTICDYCQGKTADGCEHCNPQKLSNTVENILKDTMFKMKLPCPDCQVKDNRIRELEAENTALKTGGESIECKDCYISELEARLKQAQQWRDYYRAMWMGASVVDLTAPMSDAELDKALEADND